MARWRVHIILALACAGMAAALLSEAGIARYAVPPVLAIAVLVARPLPATGPVVAAFATVLAGQLGVPPENPAPLLTIVVTGYLAGRYAGWVPGLAGVTVMILGSWVADEFSVGTFLFAAVLLGGIWGFGRVVQRRADAARIAGSEAARVAARDPAAEADRVVRAERERIAAETIMLIRSAVADMRESARAAAADLDPAPIVAVQTRGTEAVADLRRLLGLLRSAPSDPPGEDPRPRRCWPSPSELVPSLAALVLLGLDVGYVVEERSPLPWIVGVALCLVPLVQRRSPFVAALLIGGLPLLSLALGIPFVVGFSALVVVSAASWYAGAATQWVVGAGVACWVAARMWELVPHGLGNVPMELALVGLPLFAGRAWHERDRQFAQARAEIERVLGVQDAAVAQAVAGERLRIARELHDVTSHAVGVIVLQAGAAAAQRASDPDRARAALEVIETAARQATAELDLLARMLHSDGEVAPWITGEGGLAGALERLVRRMRGAGLTIAVTHDELPADHRVAGVIYRTVQEALTNAARHAPGARVGITVDRVEDGVVVEVIDSGGDGGTNADSSGFGLQGLSERVRRAILDADACVEVVGEAADGREAAALAHADRADVVLMDVQMPRCDGIEGVTAVARAQPEARVLMLTMFDLDEYVFGALRAGASGFLLKTTPPHELVAAIQAVYAGELLFAPTVTRRLVEAYVKRPPAGTVPDILAKLTERELEVFRALAKGLSNAEIARELYLGEATVKTHVTRILAKLRLRDRVQAVVLAYESGLA